VRFTSISANVSDGGYVVEFEGQLELTEAGDIKARLFELIEAGARSITVDLTRVRTIDETAIGILILADKTLRQLGGRLYVIENGLPTGVDGLLTGSGGNGWSDGRN
jgi:anti-sigma B factor antagonist